jgi:hypothetical protein
MKHVPTPVPSSAGRWVWSHKTCGSAGTLLSRKVRSGATTHVIAPEPSSVERRSLELRDTWQHVVVHPAPYLSLMPTYGGIRSVGYRQDVILSLFYKAQQMFLKNLSIQKKKLGAKSFETLTHLCLKCRSSAPIQPYNVRKFRRNKG